MNTILQQTQQPEFYPESKSPFYKIPLGRPSAYNETALALMASLLETNGTTDRKHICDSFVKHFGEGSDYADAYKRRNISKHPDNKSEFKGPIEGPWLQHAMRVVLENYAKGMDELGKGEEVDQHDAFCAALPVIAMYAGKADLWDEVEKVISLFTMSTNTKDIFHFETLLLSNYILGTDDPIEDAKKTIATSYPHVLELISKARETESLAYIDAVTTFGKSCSLPCSFQVAMLTMFRTCSFVDGVRLNITGGGCNSSRGNVIGACYGAKYGMDGIPIDWLKKVQNIEQIIQNIVTLVSK
eukprot:TRINITY_DN1246_c0_g1_i2.p1 TRINITY_DN1246_c0_g1~~TRINITY_DN1246_c0_g1_i2.p1  ORF type:complete len:300 (+),score=38.30 TRINITY_DN1246_c0_g1_i2:283-1182(+)